MRVGWPLEIGAERPLFMPKRRAGKPLKTLLGKEYCPLAGLRRSGGLDFAFMNVKGPRILAFNNRRARIMMATSSAVKSSDIEHLQVVRWAVPKGIR